ncbi:MAG: hypothetical protein ACM3ML_12355 [Micromonosporaceae bacterium]
MIKIKFTGSSGGYGGVVCEFDTVPAEGQHIRIGNWAGTVETVTHIPLRNASGKYYRQASDPAVEIELVDVHDTTSATS